MKVGDTSNANKHLNEVHKEKLLQLARTATTKKSVSFGSIDCRIINKQAHLIYLHLTKQNKRLPLLQAGFTPPKKQKVVCDPICGQELRLLIFKFINHGSHPDNTATDRNFRKVVDYVILNAKQLQGFWHVGRRGIVNIRAAEFDTFVQKVTLLLKEVFEWHVKKMVCAIVSFHPYFLSTI